MPKCQNSTELCMTAVTSAEMRFIELVFFRCSWAALTQSGYTASNSLLPPSLPVWDVQSKQEPVLDKTNTAFPNSLPLGDSFHLVLRARSAASGQCPAAVPGHGHRARAAPGKGSKGSKGSKGWKGSKGSAPGAGQSSAHQRNHRGAASSAHALRSVFLRGMSRP